MRTRTVVAMWRHTPADDGVVYCWGSGGHERNAHVVNAFEVSVQRLHEPHAAARIPAPACRFAAARHLHAASAPITHQLFHAAAIR